MMHTIKGHRVLFSIETEYETLCWHEFSVKFKHIRTIQVIVNFSRTYGWRDSIRYSNT